MSAASRVEPAVLPGAVGEDLDGEVEEAVGAHVSTA
jgi:hypothetical protein